MHDKDAGQSAVRHKTISRRPDDPGCAGSASDRFKGAWENLNTRQRRFFSAYWLDDCRSATRAAQMAGYSKTSAAARGSILLHSATGREVMGAWLDEIGVTPEAILADYLQINNADLADYEPVILGVETLVGLRERGIDTRQIRRLKITRRVKGAGDNAYVIENITIELHDRLRALDSMAKVLRLFSDDGQSDKKVTVEVLVDRLHEQSVQITTRPEDVEAAVNAAANASGP